MLNLGSHPPDRRLLGSRQSTIRKHKMRLPFRSAKGKEIQASYGEVHKVPDPSLFPLPSALGRTRDPAGALEGERQRVD